jgi:hypothetical protein
MNMHVPQAGDHVFAIGIYDLGIFGYTDFVAPAKRGNAITRNDYRHIALGRRPRSVYDRDMSEYEYLQMAAAFGLGD